MKARILIVSAITGIALISAKVKAQTVFITETGKKYHSKNCSFVKGEKLKGISLEEARKRGYQPCKPCKADEIVAAEERKKAAKK